MDPKPYKGWADVGGDFCPCGAGRGHSLCISAAQLQGGEFSGDLSEKVWSWGKMQHHSWVDQLLSRSKMFFYSLPCSTFPAKWLDARNGIYPGSPDHPMVPTSLTVLIQVLMASSIGSPVPASSKQQLSQSLLWDKCMPKYTGGWSRLRAEPDFIHWFMVRKLSTEHKFFSSLPFPSTHCFSQPSLDTAMLPWLAEVPEDVHPVCSGHQKYCSTPVSSCRHPAQHAWG